jgi:streptomycin 6-kinase
MDAATRRRMVGRFGAWVNDWCDELPALLDRLARGWGVRIGRLAPPGATSCVWFCERHDGEPAILKLSPDPTLGASEARAFAAWRSSGRVPQVLGFDDDSGALLLEAVGSGTSLADGDPAAHLGGIAELVGGLHASAGSGVMADFPPLGERVDFIFSLYAVRLRDPAVASAIPVGLLEGSLDAARRLAAEPDRRVLLHGDLHARNVLDGGGVRGLVAIDPRACVGDPAFDLIDWVLVDGDERAAMPRAEWLADQVGVDSAKLWRWCESTAVLIAISKLVRRDGPTETIRSLLALAGNAAYRRSLKG